LKGDDKYPGGDFRSPDWIALLKRRGQARGIGRPAAITIFGWFVSNKFVVMDDGNPKCLDSPPAGQQAKIRDSELLIYVVRGHGCDAFIGREDHRFTIAYARHR
jgi:hypothetical protein